MAATTSTHAVRDRRSLTRILERGGERARKERARDQYLETLSRRLSQRTGIPLARAREHVKAVAVSARKRQDPLSH